MTTTLKVIADAEPESIRLIRNIVADFASAEGLPETEIYAIETCVSEAVANAVRHAYPKDETGSIEVSVRELGDELEIVVADHGDGHVHGRSDGEHGFGLAFVSRLTDRCTFIAESDGTVVEMLFPLRHPQPTTSGTSGVRLSLDRRNWPIDPDWPALDRD